MLARFAEDARGNQSAVAIASTAELIPTNLLREKLKGY
jgi:hypothetical protein